MKWKRSNLEICLSYLNDELKSLKAENPLGERGGIRWEGRNSIRACMREREEGKKSGNMKEGEE